MSYQMTTAATPTQVLDALRVFAVNNGWTELRWGAHGTGQQCSLNLGNTFVHLRSATNESLRNGYYSAVTGIFLTGSSGFDATQPWFNQPGVIRSTAVLPPSVQTGNTEVVGLYEVSSLNTVHLFAASNPAQLFLVVEVAPGMFHHLGFGTLLTYSPGNDGGFVTGSFGGDSYIYTIMGDYLFDYAGDHHGGLPFNDFKSGGMSYVQATAEGATSWFSVCQNAPLTGKRAKSLWEYQRNGLGRVFWERAPNTLTGITPQLPFLLFVERPSGFFSPLGFTPHLRYVNIANYAPTEVFTFGTQEWRAFPAYSKNNKSGLHGFAVRSNG